MEREWKAEKEKCRKVVEEYNNLSQRYPISDFFWMQKKIHTGNGRK